MAFITINEVTSGHVEVQLHEAVGLGSPLAVIGSGGSREEALADALIQLRRHLAVVKMMLRELI